MASRSAPAGDNPFTGLIAQIELLARITRFMRRAKGEHQRRREPILFWRKRHSGPHAVGAYAASKGGNWRPT